MYGKKLLCLAMVIILTFLLVACHMDKNENSLPIDNLEPINTTTEVSLTDGQDVQSVPTT